jgi:murein DD-endopeptidase MepM/ murein hydrolase activator NlpD
MQAFLPMFIFVGVMTGAVYTYDAAFGDDAKQRVKPVLTWPLDRGEEREKKLTFGLFVTPNPEENPIDPPERFVGYHSALDVEIFPEEESVEVPVKAACDGKILQTETIPGYGGVIIQSCRINEEDVTVLYGHLDFKTFKKIVGDQVTQGEQIGFLGDEKSPETGQTRKHLHFGIHRGTEIEVRGYVQKESELGEFIDPLPLLQ